MDEGGPGLTVFDTLQEHLGYRFVNTTLLEQALRHRSTLPERGDSDAECSHSDWHNERLEFLGDAVLALMISRMLFQAYPQAAEGSLSQWRASLVNTRSLSNLGRELALGDVLHLGRGEALSGGRDKRSILAGTFEAVLGAAYLDGGEEAAATIVEGLFRHMMSEFQPEQSSKDYKSSLQELLQSKGRELPVYRVTSIGGAPHQREFSVECIAEGVAPGYGCGSSKRAAEQEAARMIVSQLIPVENT